ncbi:MAG: DUF1295 domain-containing protein [Methylophilaceae bacterium]
MIPFDASLYACGLVVTASLALLGWLVSLVHRNVTLVDSLWSLFFLLAAATYFYAQPEPSQRAKLIIVLVLLWALRLSLYLAWRNWGKAEDRRYQAIRQNNQPYFWLKSCYIIFGLQVILAWLIGLPLHAVMMSQVPLNGLDIVGLSLWLLGFGWETVADIQLARFKGDPANQNAVLNCGLWRYSRHPNYFGECCLWWGYYLFALAAGGWWTLPAPLLMTLMLLKVSGVALLEKDIHERRPAYIDYIQNTPAFLPRFFRTKS